MNWRKYLWESSGLQQKSSKKLWSSKSKDGYTENCRKHFTCTTPSPSVEELGANRDTLPWGEFMPKGKGEQENFTNPYYQWLMQTLLLRIPQFFTNTEPRWWSCLKSLPLCLLPGAGAVSAVRPHWLLCLALLDHVTKAPHHLQDQSCCCFAPHPLFPQAPSYVIDLPLPRPSCSCSTPHSLVLSWGFDLPSPGCSAAALSHPQGCNVMVLPTITRAPLLLLCIPPTGLQAGALTCQTWATAVLWPPPGARVGTCTHHPQRRLLLHPAFWAQATATPSQPRDHSTVPPSPLAWVIVAIPRDPDQGSTRDLHMPTSQIPAPASQQAYPEPRCYSSSNCTWSQDPRSAAALSVSTP